MEKLDVEFELFRRRLHNLEIRSFYLLLLDRGMRHKDFKSFIFGCVDEKTRLKDGWVRFTVLNRIEDPRSVRESNQTRKDKCEDEIVLRSYLKKG